jgi:histidyl-tRNA synthetase
MYSFTDLGNNELVLRPEGTAGAMRFLLNNQPLLSTIEKEPVKMWYMGPMFRYERPQNGRMR